MVWKIDLPAARYCRDVYIDPDRLIGPSLSGVIHVEGKEQGADAFIFETEEFNWVVFRGVDIWTGEFWLDLKTALKAYWKRVNGAHGSLKLHRGFFEAWQEISAEVAEEIMSLRVEQSFVGTEKPTVYCGHSAGGALAGIAAATHRPYALVTFGAPRFSGKALGEYLSYIDRVHRWVNGSDWVPFVPFGFGYRHHGEQHHIGYDGSVVVNPPVRRKVKEFFLNLGGARRNHRMTEYWYGIINHGFGDVFDG